MSENGKLILAGALCTAAVLLALRRLRLSISVAAPPASAAPVSYSPGPAPGPAAASLQALPAARKPKLETFHVYASAAGLLELCPSRSGKRPDIYGGFIYSGAPNSLTIESDDGTVALPLPAIAAGSGLMMPTLEAPLVDYLPAGRGIKFRVADAGAAFALLQVRYE